MKVRLTIIAENDTPEESIGATKEEQEMRAKITYEILLILLQNMADTEHKDRISIESVEVLE